MNLSGASTLIYLDSQASTRVDDRVLERMLPFFKEGYANASGGHAEGRRLFDVIESCRAQIASDLKCSVDEVFFTSGATESNNLVFHLVGQFLRQAGRNRILVSAVEHKSVLDPAFLLKEQGFVVDLIPVNSEGLVEVDALESMIDDQVGLVSVMGANNEIGTIQDLLSIGEICGERDVLFHTDFAQGVGYLDPCLKEAQVAFATFSAHKCYGPKGVGALYIAGGTKSGLHPMIVGGGQEKALRSGTLNVPGIVGLAEAIRLQVEESSQRAEHLLQLRDVFLSELREQRVNFKINGTMRRRLPGNLNLWFEGVEAEQLIYSLPEIVFSNGSACNSRAISPSHVLTAIGCDRTRAFESIRISFGKDNSIDEVRLAAWKVGERVNIRKSVNAGR